MCTPLLPLELWHNVFEYLDLPRVDLKIADWSGIEFPNLQMHNREPNVVATILALTHQDILFPGSTLAIWKWLASVASWRVDRSTDAWRLWRLERSYNLSIKCVTTIAYFPEKTYDDRYESRLSQSLDSQYETFKDLAKLSNLHKLFIVVTCEYGDEGKVLIERLRNVIGDAVNVIQGKMVPGCTVIFNFMVYSTKRYLGVERTTWSKPENITDQWRRPDSSPSLEEELDKIRSLFLLERLADAMVAQHISQSGDNDASTSAMTRAESAT
jgi:hypothetical protein